MSSHIASLLRTTRLQKRPSWSQRFLKDEIASLGLAVTHGQIVRVEHSDVVPSNWHVFVAMAVALDVPHEALRQALEADLTAVFDDIQSRRTALGG